MRDDPPDEPDDLDLEEIYTEHGEPIAHRLLGCIVLVLLESR